jgi:hypothetical protein
MRPSELHRLARVLGKRATLGAMSTIACAAVLAACGGGSEDDEGSIPAQAAESIETMLDDVQEAFDAGECEAAAASAAEIQATIAGLGADVEGDLEEALVQASDNLVTLVREDCKPPEEEPPTDEVPPTGVTGEEGAVP